MASDFVYNPAVEQAILQSPALRFMLGAKAQRVGEIAIATAPVGSGPAHDQRVQEGTDYKSNISAGIIDVGGRPAGRVLAEAPHSVFVEFGTSKMEPFATLRRALEAGAAT
jgi:hypothetical protein